MALAAAVVLAAVVAGLQVGLIRLPPGTGSSPSPLASSSASPSAGVASLADRVAQTFPTGVGDPTGVVHAFGSVWVGGHDGLVRLDPQTGAIQAEIALPGLGCGPLLASGQSIWFASCGSGAGAGVDRAGTLRIDPTTNTVADDYSDATTDGVGIGSLSGAVWFISDVNSGELTQVSEDGGEILQRVTIGIRIRHLTAGFGSLWVQPPAIGEARVLRVDAATGEVVASVALSGDAGFLATGPDAIWVAEPFQWLLARVDPITNSLEAELLAGVDADQVVLGDGTVWLLTVDAAIGYEMTSNLEVDRFSVPPHLIFGSIATQPLAASPGGLWYAESGVLHRLTP